MPGDTRGTPAPRITGRVLHIDDNRRLAIYMRGGVVQFAEFTDKGGELVDAATWFSSCMGAAGLSRSARKRALDSADAIPPDIASAIEELHTRSEPRTTMETSLQASMLAVVRVLREISHSIRQWSDYRQQILEMRAPRR